jgi:hypothetical protein
MEEKCYRCTTCGAEMTYTELCRHEHQGWHVPINWTVDQTEDFKKNILPEAIQQMEEDFGGGCT